MEKDYFYDSYRLVEFYDDMYSHTFDFPFWNSYAAKSKRIMEIACGTGRITIPLLKAGHHITGLDYSPEMLSILQKKVTGTEYEHLLTLIQGDMREFQTEDKFDAIFITANSLNHIETNEDLLKTFSTIKSNLTDDGYLIFDILNPKPEYLIRSHGNRYDHHVYKKEDDDRYFMFCESSQYNHAEQINYVRYYFNYCDDQGVRLDKNTYIMDMKVRLFFPQEMDSYINSAGFKIIDKFETYDFRRFSGKTNEQIYVLKKEK